jgi:hypothetical protein
VKENDLQSLIVGGSPLAEVIEISTTPVSDDETGPLRGAYLRVVGTLKRLELYKVGFLNFRTLAQSWVMTVNGAVMRPARQLQEDRWRYNFSTPEVALDIDPLCADGETLTGLHCVGIFKDSCGSVMGLLLESVPEFTGAFRRLGTFTIYFYDEAPLIDNFLSNSDEEASIPCESYHVKEKKHVFRLI